MDVRICSNCGKKYKVTERDLPLPGTIEREGIYCPWCNSVEGQLLTNGLVYTEKVEENE